MICKSCAHVARVDNDVRESAGTAREDWVPARHPCDNPNGCTCQHNKRPVVAPEGARKVCLRCGRPVQFVARTMEPGQRWEHVGHSGHAAMV